MEPATFLFILTLSIFVTWSANFLDLWFLTEIWEAYYRLSKDARAPSRGIVYTEIYRFILIVHSFIQDCKIILIKLYVYWY